MPNGSIFLTFILALVVLEVTPGPDMMLIIARGVGQGRETALMTVVGMIFVAGAVQVSLLVLGLASLVAAYPAAITSLRWAGAAYLIYLGAKMVLASFGQQAKRRTNAGPVSGWKAIREGTLNSLTNPKSLLFMFTFLPLFVDPKAGPVWLQLLILGSIQKLVSIFSLGGVALASGTIGGFISRYPKLLAWQERFTGIALLGLGVRLFLTGSASPAPSTDRL
jgi:threonine/homoserine/homoserine lactone efflux protein